MAAVAVSALLPRQRPRGKISLNGWDECKVNGRSLAALRNEMLREKKPPAASTPAQAPPKQDADAPPPAQTYDKQKVGAPAPTQASVRQETEGPAKQPDAQNDSQPCHGQASKSIEKIDEGRREPPLETTKSGPLRSRAQPQQEAKPAQPQPDAQPPPHARPPTETQPQSDVQSQPRGQLHPQPQPRPLSPPSAKDNSKLDPAAQVSHGPPVKALERAESDKPLGGHSKSDGTATVALAPKSNAKPIESTKATPPPAEESATAPATDEVLPQPPSQEIEKASPIPETRAARSASRSPPKALPVAEVGTSPASSAQGEKRGEKRSKSESPSKSEKRRKRNDPQDTSVSQANTPLRRSQERSSRPRSDWARNGRKHDIPSASELDTDAMDPDAMEAAAIAAQAEKEEANSRARRTTRLAAGKIKQVDYKASVSAVGSRSFSPGNDYDDGDAHSHGNDAAAEPTRSSRRRATQNQSAVPQRSSRRVARMRSSQEKDQSSNEDLDVSGGRISSGGNGSDGRPDGDGDRHHSAMEIDTGTTSRANGARSDGRERKRTRGETGSRRTRQNQPDGTDGDAGEKLHATRSSTRESSVVDAAEVGADGNDHIDAIDDASLDFDDDPDKRKDALGWTFHDLTKIGDAVDIADSTAQEAINVELFQADGWSSDEPTNKRVATYVERAVANIKALKVKVYPGKPCDVTVCELRAYIATNVWRLKHGGIRTAYPRNQRHILRKTEREDLQKANFERARKKHKKEVDEVRQTLETDMEARRRAELELAYAEIVQYDLARELPLEEARLLRMEKDTERYVSLESHARNNLDRTKLLVSQLRGEKDSTDDVPPFQAATAPQSPVAKGSTWEIEEKAKTDGEAVIENGDADKDVLMTDQDITNTSHYQVEIERLQDQLAVREAQAEAYQRCCERERMRVSNLREAKTRLETDLYLSRHFSYSGSGSGTVGSHGSNTRKHGSDPSRRGENRSSGPSAHRSSGASKEKSGNGKTSGSHAVSHGTKVSAPSRPKSSHGRNGDSKGSKRRSNGPSGSKVESSGATSGKNS